MNFITLDFETATSQRHSPGQNGFNIYIHGTTPKDTDDKPEFNEIWPDLRPLLENQFLNMSGAQSPAIITC